MTEETEMKKTNLQELVNEMNVGDSIFTATSKGRVVLVLMIPFDGHLESNGLVLQEYTIPAAESLLKSLGDSIDTAKAKLQANPS